MTWCSTRSSTWEARWASQLARVEFAVEDVPPELPAYDRMCAEDGEVPLARLLPSRSAAEAPPESCSIGDRWKSARWIARTSRPPGPRRHRGAGGETCSASTGRPVSKAPRGRTGPRKAEPPHPHAAAQCPSADPALELAALPFGQPAPDPEAFVMRPRTPDIPVPAIRFALPSAAGRVLPTTGVSRRLTGSTDQPPIYCHASRVGAAPLAPGALHGLPHFRRDDLRVLVVIVVRRVRRGRFRSRLWRAPHRTGWRPGRARRQ